jgi:hypothetical protein
MTTTITSRKWIVKKSYQAERLLDRYYSIIARDFSEPGDYNYAQRTLAELAVVFKHVGRKEDADMLKLIKEQQQFIEELLALRVEMFNAI